MNRTKLTETQYFAILKRYKAVPLAGLYELMNAAYVLGFNADVLHVKYKKPKND